MRLRVGAPDDGQRVSPQHTLNAELLMLESRLSFGKQPPDGSPDAGAHLHDDRMVSAIGNVSMS